MVDTSLGEMEDNLASDGFAAQALTVLPIMVRSKNQMRASTVRGTRITTARSAPRTLTPATVHDPPKALGKCALGLDGAGISMAIACAKPAMPMVATRTTTRGAALSRRMTVISTIAPKARPISNAITSAAQNGTLYWIVSSDSVTAPTTPILPTAKLMILVAR